MTEKVSDLEFKKMGAEEKFNYLIETAYFSNEEFLIHDSGVYQISYNKLLEIKEWKLLHHSFVLPIEYLQLNPKASEKTANNNVQMNETYVRVLYKSSDGNKNSYSLLPFQEFDDICKSKLRKTDWSKPSRFERAFQAALQVALKTGQSEYVRHDGKIAKPFVVKKRCFNKKGWVQDNKWIHIRDNHPQFVGNTKQRTMSAGSAILCVNTYKKMMKHSLQSCFEMAFHALSYTQGFLRPSNNFSPMYVKFGEPGSGKSSSSIMMNAIECCPQKDMCLFLDRRTSAVAFERILADYNNGFMHIDEIDIIAKGNPDDTAERIIDLCDGSPRSVADQDSEYTQGKVHKGALIATANTPLSEVMKGSGKAAAAMDRIIEINFQDEEIYTYRDISLAEIEEFHNTLLENYGHIYPLFVDYISKNRAKLKEDLLTYEDEIEEGKTKYRSKQIIALLRIGADIVSAVFGIEYGKRCHTAIDIVKRRKFEESSSVVKNFEEVKIMLSLKEWIKANKNCFEWSTFAYSKDETGYHRQKEEARTLTANASKRNGGVFGVIKLEKPCQNEDDLNGTIVIWPNGQENMKRTHKILPADIKKAAEKLDIARVKRLSGNQRETKKEFLENNIFDELVTNATSALEIQLTDYKKFIQSESVVEENDNEIEVSNKEMTDFTKQSRGNDDLINSFDMLKDLNFIEDTPPFDYSDNK
ncbi:hypothetical protein E1N66_10405 [Pantoea allii]|nr:hypothetical protein [Pantoea allii]THB84435.1 hypothetical protein E1N66_10405 [Pantoea allii]